MKKIIVIAFLVGSVSAIAQKIQTSKVPQAVQVAFHRNFERVKEADWETEKGNYEANFKLDGLKVSATFDKDGKWIETGKEIAVNTLPAEAASYIQAHCKDKAIKRATVTNMASGDVNYEAKVQGKEYVFDKNGKFLKIDND